MKMTIRNPLELAQAFHQLGRHHIAGYLLRIHIERSLRSLAPGTKGSYDSARQLVETEVIDGDQHRALKLALKYCHKCCHGRNIAWQFHDRSQNAFDQARLLSEMVWNIRVGLADGVDPIEVSPGIFEVNGSEVPA